MHRNVPINVHNRSPTFSVRRWNKDAKSKGTGDSTKKMAENATRGRLTIYASHAYVFYRGLANDILGTPPHKTTRFRFVALYVFYNF